MAVTSRNKDPIRVQATFRLPFSHCSPGVGLMMHILDVKAGETKNEQEDSNASPLSVLMMSVKNNTQPTIYSMWMQLGLSECGKDCHCLNNSTCCEKYYGKSQQHSLVGTPTTWFHDVTASDPVTSASPAT
ncbi:hypothetical protein HanIR_Chr08g0353651 [Helianthus annuus]|nr:hypothetical protein HanIR_Chr08g0353651 [Helianthus annuus]